MVLTAITLKNFQSHADSHLDLSPGLTAIVGETDAGKSAILRAMNWVANNRPRGVGVIRHGESEAEVILETTEGSVSRFRSSKATKDNSYTVCQGGREREIFSVVGTGVPTTVEDLLGFSELNLQRQFDPHFLVFDPPSKLAATISEACDLDLGVKALKEIATMKRGAHADERSARKSLEETKELLSAPEYQGLPRLIELGEQASDAYQIAYNDNAKMAVLQSCSFELQELNSWYRYHYARTKEIGKVLSRAASTMKTRDAARDRLTSYQDLRSEHRSLSCFVSLRPKLDSLDILIPQLLQASIALDQDKKRLHKLSVYWDAKDQLSIILAKRNDLSIAAIAMQKLVEVSDKGFASQSKFGQLSILQIERNVLQKQVYWSGVELGTFALKIKSFVQENPTCELCGAALDETGKAKEKSNDS